MNVVTRRVYPDKGHLCGGCGPGMSDLQQFWGLLRTHLWQAGLYSCSRAMVNSLCHLNNGVLRFF